MATSVIFDNLNNEVKNIYPIEYSLINIKEKTRDTVISSVLPFRVKFTAIQIESLSSNPPAIPFQVIGYSNYIL